MRLEGLGKRIYDASRVILGEDLEKLAIARQPSGALSGTGDIRPVPTTIPYGFRPPYGYNLNVRPRATEPVTFKALRNIASSCELIRVAIQLKKEQIRGLDWDITVKQGANAERLEPRRRALKRFFRKPDPLNDFNFSDFMAAFLEDLLVLDAGVVYFLKDRAGRVTGMSVVDGSTIQPVLTNGGYVPMPPLPAYAQVIDGRITGTWTREEMLYCQYNPTTDSAYGTSHVEMVLTSAHISLLRQLSNLGYYKEGNVPEHLLVAPPEWSVEQIRQVQEYLDAYFSGDVSKKHKLKLVPGGLTPKELRTQDFTVAVDEWLAKIVASVFQVAPHVLLGRVRTVQQGQVIEEQQTDVGLNPFKKYLSEGFTEKVIFEQFGEDELQLSWLSDKAQAEEKNIKKAKAMLPYAVVGVDELRVAEGKDPIGIPPYITLPNGILFITREMAEKLKSGEIGFIDAKGIPHSYQELVAQAALSVEPTGQQPVPSGAAKALFDLEAGQWHRFAVSDVKKLSAPRAFANRFIPEEVAAAVREELEGCTTTAEVAEIFSDLCYIEKRSGTQTVLFDSSKWTVERARKWLKRNSLKSSSVEETEHFYRFRQFDPSECSGNYKTLAENLPAGVKLVVCERK